MLMLEDVEASGFKQEWVLMGSVCLRLHSTLTGLIISSRNGKWVYL